MPGTRERLQRESRSLIAAGVAAAIGVLVAVVALPAGEIPLSGAWSLGSVAAVTSAAVGAPIVVWSYVASSRARLRWRRSSPLRRIVDTAGLVLAGCGMAFLLILSVFALFQLAFRDLVVDRFAAAALAAATVAATGYVLALIVSRVTTTTLATLLGLFLIAGVFASMLTADDPAWWQRHFSALGAGNALSALAFNLTLVIAGLVLITLADYLTQDLRARPGASGAGRHGVTIVRLTLMVVGLALIGVGLVPVDASVIIHNLFAVSLLVAFGALIVLVPVLIGGLPHSFTVTTGVFAAGIVAVVLLFIPIGYFNLTAVELIAVILIFAWLLLFTRQVAEPVAEAPAVIVPGAAGADPEQPPRSRTRLALIGLALAAFGGGILVSRLLARPGAGRLR